MQSEPSSSEQAVPSQTKNVFLHQVIGLSSGLLGEKKLPPLENK